MEDFGRDPGRRRGSTRRPLMKAHDSMFWDVLANAYEMPLSTMFDEEIRIRDSPTDRLD